MAELRETARGLEVRASADELREVQHLSEMTALATLLEVQMANGWTLCEADQLGCLSQAPVLSRDIVYGERAEYDLAPGGRFYYFEPYQLRGVIYDLERRGVAVFSEAKESDSE